MGWLMLIVIYLITIVYIHKFTNLKWGFILVCIEKEFLFQDLGVEQMVCDYHYSIVLWSLLAGECMAACTCRVPPLIFFLVRFYLFFIANIEYMMKRFNVFLRKKYRIYVFVAK